MINWTRPTLVSTQTRMNRSRLQHWAKCFQCRKTEICGTESLNWFQKLYVPHILSFLPKTFFPAQSSSSLSGDPSCPDINSLNLTFTIWYSLSSLTRLSKMVAILQRVDSITSVWRLCMPEARGRMLPSFILGRMVISHYLWYSWQVPDDSETINVERYLPNQRLSFSAF